MNLSIRTTLLACILTLGSVARTYATPYASGLTINGGTLSFVLNEDAGDVTVSFDDNSTVSDIGPMSRGTNTFALGTHTNFSIAVAKSANGVFASISSDSNRYMNFFGPRGIAVNHNPRTANFGRAYVVCASSGTAAVVARPTGRGIYVVGADQTDVLGKADTAQLPSPMFIGSSTTYAPHRVSVGSDDTVYVSDGTALSGGGSTMGNGVWALSGDLTSPASLFTNRSGSTNVFYGPVNSRPVVTGSLAQNNLVLYAVEWNLTPYNSIWKHVIGGAASLPSTTVPTALGGIGFSSVNGVNGDLTQAPDGKFFASAYRSASPSYETNVMVFDTDGKTMLWNSCTAIGSPTSGPGDPFSNTYGVAVSPDGKLFATVLNGGDIVIVNLTNGIPDLSTLRTNTIGGGATARGIDFDAADNIYWSSGGAELLRIYTLAFSNSLAITSNDATGTNGTYAFVAIAAHPQNVRVTPGGSATLTTTAYGSNLTYQWIHNGGVVPAATANKLSIASTSSSDFGSYQVVVSSGAASLTSVIAVISSATDPAPPTLVTQPQSQTVAALGGAAGFSVSASGYPLNYQWYANGNAVSGGTSSALSLANVQNSDLGTYAVIVSNNLGTATSSAVTLSLTPPTPVWRQLPNTPGGGSIRHDDIQFLDPLNGWASQNPYIFHTTNGGLTWTTNFNKTGAHFRSVTFVNSNVGFAGNLGVGSYDGGVTDTNVLYRTFDGGKTWAPVPGLAEAGMKGFCAMYLLDSNHIYGGGRVRGPAFFAKSEDGGTNWTTVSLTAQGVMNGIMDVYFRDTNTGWVVGMDNNSFATSCGSVYHGAIAKTTNGGATWLQVAATPVTCSYFWKMAWPSTNIGYASLQQNAASFYNIVYYKTTDGGNNWVSNGVPLASLGLGTSGFYLQAIGFVSTNEGWMGGASGNPNFIHTIDGGQTWSTATYTDTSFMNRIRFVSPTLGYASGWNLHVYSILPTIVTQPQSQTVVAPTNVILNVGVTSTAPGGLAYQWKENGTNRPGATSSTLVLNNVTRLDSGAYSVSITNTFANAQSSNAIVRVIVPERLAPPTLQAGGGVNLLFNDADGGALLTTNDLATFSVYASSNMVDWVTVTNALSLTNGQALLQDVWTNSPQRYYKVTEQ
jgi:hypothetical protein